MAKKACHWPFDSLDPHLYVADRQTYEGFYLCDTELSDGRSARLIIANISQKA